MFEKILGRVPPVEDLLRNHLANLGTPDDLVVFEANDNAVAFRYLAPLSLHNTCHLIRTSSQICLIFFNVRISSKKPDPQISFGRKECHATMPEALDALTPYLNPIIRARKSFNFSAERAVRAETPLAAWDLYRTHVGTRDFIRAHSLLTAAAASHYGTMQTLKGASKIAKLFPDAKGFEKVDSYSHFVGFQGDLVPYRGEEFEVAKLLFYEDEAANRRAKNAILTLRTGPYWRIAYLPWNLGKRIWK